MELMKNSGIECILGEDRKLSRLHSVHFRSFLPPFLLPPSFSLSVSPLLFCRTHTHATSHTLMYVSLPSSLCVSFLFLFVVLTLCLSFWCKWTACSWASELIVHTQSEESQTVSVNASLHTVDDAAEKVVKAVSKK